MFESRFNLGWCNRMAESTNVNGISPEMVADAPGQSLTKSAKWRRCRKTPKQLSVTTVSTSISRSRVLRYSIPTGCHGFRPHAFDGAVVYGELRTRTMGAPTTYKWKNLKPWPIFAAIQVFKLAQCSCRLHSYRLCVATVTRAGYARTIRAKTCRLSKNSTTGSLGLFPNRLHTDFDISHAISL